MRPQQKRLMQEVLPRCAILSEGPLDPLQIFPETRGLGVEIGFGGGEHLAAQAQLHPDWGFLGAEPFINGVAKLLAHISQQSLNNVRMLMGDGRSLLERLPDACADAVYILFPDPWPKARHFKRRIIQPETLDQIVRILKEQGELRVATDVPDYAVWTLMHAGKRRALRFAADSPRDWHERPVDWPPTRYELKARAAGRSCVYLRYLKFSHL